MLGWQIGDGLWIHITDYEVRLLFSVALDAARDKVIELWSVSIEEEIAIQGR
jgi:hypothetical protein